MLTGEAAVLADIAELVREGILIEPRVAVTLVGAQRSQREDDAYDFVVSVGTKYPHAEVIVGDTSNIEKAAALAAEHMNLSLTVVPKAKKGEWDEGAELRDERVVALATQVVAFDTSSRSTNYERLAKRTLRPFHQVKEAAKP